MTAFLLTLVGKDQPGIVAGVTQALFDEGLNLGEANMARLGDSFTIMLSVTNAISASQVKNAVANVSQRMGLHVHVDQADSASDGHVIPNVCVTVYGADRAGIVAQVTGILLDCQLNILHLETAVGGDADKPIYVMQIEGVTETPIETVEGKLGAVKEGGVEVQVDALDLLVG